MKSYSTYKAILLMQVVHLEKIPSVAAAMAKAEMGDYTQLELLVKQLQQKADVKSSAPTPQPAQTNSMPAPKPYFPGYLHSMSKIDTTKAKDPAAAKADSDNFTADGKAFESKLMVY